MAPKARPRPGAVNPRPKAKAKAAPAAVPNWRNDWQMLIIAGLYVFIRKPLTAMVALTGLRMKT